MTNLLDHFAEELETPNTEIRLAVMAHAEPSGFEIHIDQDVHRGPTTPIARLYLREIARTRAGDKLIILQKNLTQPRINLALIQARLRGVEVIAIFRDNLNPACMALQTPGQRAACGQIFKKSPHPHHKSMMVLTTDGTVRAIVGSYNTRKQKAGEKRPRTHTVLFFKMPRGRALFAFYEAEANRLLSRPARLPKILTLRTRRGVMKFTMHPDRTNPALELLNNVSGCQSTTIWLAYYNALPDAQIGLPVFNKLQNLRRRGCRIKILLDANRVNRAAYDKLRQLNLEVRWARFPTGVATLGNKLVLAKTGDDVHIIQSSANLSASHHLQKHNLTLYLRGRGFLSIYQTLEREVSRYW
jgi:hypothetical protein